MMVRQERFLKTFLVLTAKASFDAPVRYLYEIVTLSTWLQKSTTRNRPHPNNKAWRARAFTVFYGMMVRQERFFKNLSCLDCQSKL
ncbi:MAG: hypothetical protein B6242_14115 [Anaerolineaceae bacterium 4572_78]|nr:MAG: hypothetical protein B6242_14115 [Anaerolineaceae bacterium 4572_78]